MTKLGEMRKTDNLFMLLIQELILRQEKYILEGQEVMEHQMR